MTKSSIDRKVFLFFVAISFAMAFWSFSYNFFCNNLLGTEVTITPDVNNPTEETVVFRGAWIDSKWYYPEQMVRKGYSGWKYDSITRTFTAESLHPLSIRIPQGEVRGLVFNSGPQNGRVAVDMENTQWQVDLYSDFEADGGKSYEVIAGNSMGIIGVMSAVTAIAVFGILVLGYYTVEKYDSIIPWKKVEIAFLVLLFPLAILYLMYYSASSTPFSKEFYGYDAAIFTVVGNAWGEGKIPYKDVFDHKGPLTFFLYMLGNKIDSVAGLFAIQCVFLWVALIFAYFIGKKITDEKGGIITTALTLVYLMLVLDEGGLTEEFNLPFLMIGFYLFVDYAQKAKENPEHSPLKAFVYGIIVGVSLYLRVTNCVSICAFVMCIVILLLVKKKYWNILQNGLSFCAGILFVVLPFWIYFVSQGAGYDMWWGTLLYNIQYASESVLYTMDYWAKFAVYLSPVLLCIVLSFRQDWFFSMSMLFSSFMTAALLLKSNLFPHYYIILVPYAAIAVALALKESEKSESQKLNHYKVSYYVLMALCVVIVGVNAQKFVVERVEWTTRMRDFPTDSAYYTALETQVSLIPDEDRDKVIGYNMEAAWYLRTGIIPCYKYFILQDWQMAHSDKMIQENMEFYSSKQAEWILVGETKIGQQEIAQIINDNYELYNSIYIEEGDYTLDLYHKKV